MVMMWKFASGKSGFPLQNENLTGTGPGHSWDQPCRSQFISWHSAWLHWLYYKVWWVCFVTVRYHLKGFQGCLDIVTACMQELWTQYRTDLTKSDKYCELTKQALIIRNGDLDTVDTETEEMTLVVILWVRHEVYGVEDLGYLTYNCPTIYHDVSVFCMCLKVDSQAAKRPLSGK